MLKIIGLHLNVFFNIYQSRTAPLKVSEDNEAKVKFKATSDFKVEFCTRRSQNVHFCQIIFFFYLHVMEKQRQGEKEKLGGSKEIEIENFR